MNVTRSHAAPFIREALVNALRNADDARTLRSRREHMGQAYAYANALKIMATSEDQVAVEGVSSVESMDIRDLGRVRKFLGTDDDFEQVMGIPAVEPFDFSWQA